jgi:CRISPR-associated endonuclease Csn1
MEKFMSNYIWGIDLGVQSIGFAVVKIDKNEKPVAIERLGVRCFDSIMDNIRDWEKGSLNKDKTSAKTKNRLRREKRGTRRRIWRIQRRKRALFNLLRKHGLLPMGHGLNDTPKQRQELINDLDRKLSEQLGINDRLPYELRSLALDKKLKPFALGRVILSLAQRRGFKSNKKTEKPGDKNESVVKSGISDLQNEIDKKNFRTLGELFASLRLDEKRIRQRWTAREMYENEFEKICNAQKKYYHKLFNTSVTLESWRNKSRHFNPKNKNQKTHKPKTLTLLEAIKHYLFFQRPLKSQRHLIGKCLLEPTKRRARTALILFQEFRYWQKVLDLKIIEPCGKIRELSKSERIKLAEKLELVEKMTFEAMKKTLNLSESHKFNFEVEGEKEIKGNITTARIRKIIPKQWDAMSSEDKNLLIDEILQFSDKQALARRIAKVFQFDKNNETNKSLAEKVADVYLERNYANLSLEAIRNILPLMKGQHLNFAGACDKIYGKELKSKIYKKLPPVLLAAPGLKQPHLLKKTYRSQPQVKRNFRKKSVENKERKKSRKSYTVQNPIVLRAMTELRKIVNALLRKYGLPKYIYIELARDLKKSRKARQKYKAEADANRERRKEIKAKIEAKHGKAASENENNIFKWRLAEECNWKCPYTGKNIPKDLKGLSQFDVEHIIPFCRSLENSFANKTLCDPEYNLNIKKNQLPCDLPNFSEILDRVKNFTVLEKQNKSSKKKKKSFNPKLKRFQITSLPDLPSRFLNDTRYISKAAGNYLGLLYGGQVDAKNKRRIRVSSGGMTHYLCKQWELYKIINKDGKNQKYREDHRHHAIDAVAIALCTPSLVKELSSEAEKASKRYKTGIGRDMPTGRILLPIPDLVEQVEKAAKKINVSHRIDRTVSGGFHDETNYSSPQISRDENGKTTEYRHLRKPLQSMSEGEIEDIVDPAIRKLVKEKLKRLGGDPKKFIEKELPYVTTKSGQIIPIRKARIRKNIGTMTLAPTTAKERHVAPGNNHHIEIVAILDKDGKETRWEGTIVTMFEAYQRKHRKEQIVNRNHGEGKKFKFSISGGEYLEMENEKNKTILCRITTISGDSFEGRLHYDARPITEMKKIQGARIRGSINGLLKRKARKVFVDVLGKIHPAND